MAHKILGWADFLAIVEVYPKIYQILTIFWEKSLTKVSKLVKIVFIFSDVLARLTWREESHVLKLIPKDCEVGRR